MYRLLAAIVLLISNELGASRFRDDALSCESVDILQAALAEPSASCVIHSLDEISSSAPFLIIQLSLSESKKNTPLESAQLMSEKQFWNSSFLKKNSNLIVSNNPFLHFRPGLCGRLQSQGFVNTKVLAYGVSSYLSSRDSTIQGGYLASRHLIEPEDFIERYSYVPYLLVAQNAPASRRLSELKMPHQLIEDSENLRKRVYEVIATSANRPVVLVGDDDDRTSAWVSNLDINQLFLLRGGASSLLRVKDDIQRLNLSRTGVSKRAACAGA